MTRSELIAALASRFPSLMAKDTKIVTKEILDAIENTLTHGGRVEIRGFGTFGLNYRSSRTGRNPQTGELVRVPEKFVPHFKAAKKMRERIEFSIKHDQLKRAA